MFTGQFQFLQYGCSNRESCVFCLQDNSSFSSMGAVTGKVVCRCTDPDLMVRTLAVDCLHVLLKVALRYEGMSSHLSHHCINHCVIYGLKWIVVVKSSLTFEILFSFLAMYGFFSKIFLNGFIESQESSFQHNNKRFKGLVVEIMIVTTDNIYDFFYKKVAMF